DHNTYKVLEQLFENRRSSGRTLIYRGCSTFVGGDQRRLKKIIEAVANCPKWDLVLGLGGQLTPEQLDPLPSNVYAFGWAPQLQILQQADCAVVDAGSSAIRECIYAGVPMLIYSRGRDDQNGNQVRVVYHGLGIAGDRVQDSAAQIRTHIQTLLTDRSYQTRVNHMRDCFRRYAHENRAVQVVDALLNCPEKRPTKALMKMSPAVIETAHAKGGAQ
ncbi:MAG: nucleotide disphospho-sugar-binding domain-containing protein, partial [Cyanobacteria bacterium P01_F01_bin.4]